MLWKINLILSLLLLGTVLQVSAAGNQFSISRTLEYQTTVRSGVDFERLPDRIGRSQAEEQGLFTELGFRVTDQINDDWSLFTDVRALAATSQINSIFDSIENDSADRTSSTNSYLQLRQLWMRYHGITNYPDEHLTFGLQRIRANSSLWWDADLESLVWRLSTTRFRFQTGIGERLDTYRTNNELAQVDEDKLRLFAEIVYDWQAYHELNLRTIFSHQNSKDIAESIQTGAPDGLNGEWIWFGLGLSSNWLERRSNSPFAYNLEWISLTGQSDFLNESGEMLKDHDIAAWAVDAGIRYDLSDTPASFGVTFSRGSGGFDKNESNMFAQTGLHTNRDRFVGNRQFLFRYNEALRADLANLQHAAVFASYTFNNNYLLAASLSNFQRDDSQSPIYRNRQPLNIVPGGSDDVGDGMDLSFRHNITRPVLSIPLQYWRIRGSAFLPGDAFNDNSDDTIYRAVLEVVGEF